MLFFYLSLIEDKDEQSKFEKLYYEYRHLMTYIAFDILKDEKLAEDAVHNAFIKISNNLKKINEISCHKKKSFIVVVIENVAKDMYRKRKREKEIPFEENIDIKVSDDFSLNSFGIETIVSKIESLPDIYRNILVLKYLQELNNKEIAKLLNIKESTVRKRLERAKDMLAELLEKDGDYYDLQGRR